MKTKPEKAILVALKNGPSSIDRIRAEVFIATRSEIPRHRVRAFLDKAEFRGFVVKEAKEGDKVQRWRLADPEVARAMEVELTELKAKYASLEDSYIAIRKEMQAVINHHYK